MRKANEPRTIVGVDRTTISTQLPSHSSISIDKYVPSVKRPWKTLLPPSLYKSIRERCINIMIPPLPVRRYASSKPLKRRGCYPRANLIINPKAQDRFHLQWTLELQDGVGRCGSTESGYNNRVWMCLAYQRSSGVTSLQPPAAAKLLLLGALFITNLTGKFKRILW